MIWCVSWLGARVFALVHVQFVANGRRTKKKTRHTRDVVVILSVESSILLSFVICMHPVNWFDALEYTSKAKWVVCLCLRLSLVWIRLIVAYLLNSPGSSASGSSVEVIAYNIFFSFKPNLPNLTSMPFGSILKEFCFFLFYSGLVVNKFRNVYELPPPPPPQQTRNGKVKMKFIINIIFVGEHLPECIFPFIHNMHNISPERPFAKTEILSRVSKLGHLDLRVCADASRSRKK